MVNKEKGGKQMKQDGKWDGFRRLVLVDKIKECDDITSFYFKAEDGGKLVKHEAGQFLPFKIVTEEEAYKDVMRTYSLSIIPNDDLYRISVKKVLGGLISTYLHEKFEIGDCIEAMIPMGLFTLQEKSPEAPITLISGGIGITPLLSMLYEVANTKKALHFIQAVQNSKNHPFQNDIHMITKDKGFKNTVFYSNPLENDVKGKDYDELGFVTKEWLATEANLASTFYICGPPVFMKVTEENLISLGVSKDRIYYELFSQ